MKYFKIPAMLLMLLAFTGCIKENLDDCPPPYNVALNFSYFYNKLASGNLFTGRVDNVGIFVYDAAGNFVTSFFKGPEDFLLYPAQARIFLNPGEYRLVCWGNDFEHTDIQAGLAGQPLSAARVFHTGRARGESDNGDPLFYAPRMANLNNPNANILLLTVPQEGVVQQPVNFTATHKTLEVIIKGFRDEDGRPCPNVVITGQPLAYNFLMQPIVGGNMEYRQRAVEEEWTAQHGVATFYVPLFEWENDINIQVVRPSNNALVHTISLHQYFVDNPIALTSLDWDKVSIIIEFNDLGAVVSVEPWNGSWLKPGVF